MSKFNAVRMAAEKRGRIELYGDIGPAWAGMIDEKVVASALRGLGDVTEIELRINSRGGDAYSGVSICNLLKEHPAIVHGHVDGVAVSAASLILMGCDTITIPKNGQFMLHDPATFAFGDKLEFQRRLAQLESMETAAIETYAAKNKKKTKEEIAALMHAETWYTGEQAVEAGFADSTDPPINLPADAPTVIPDAPQNRFRHAPAQLASLLSISMSAKQEPPKMADQTNPAPSHATNPAPAATPAPEPNAAPALAPPANPAAAAIAPTQSAETPAQLERKRCSDITALCSQAGKPELAAGFIDRDAPVNDVRTQLFNAMCSARQPIDAGGNGNANPAPADPNVKFKSEYAAGREVFQKSGTTEEEYIASRRVDEGIDVLRRK